MSKLGVLTTAVVALGYLTGCDSGSESAAQTGCSLATLAGNYIYAYDGFTVMGPSMTDRLPFASAGHETYSGDGEVNGIATTNANGVVTTAAYTGTYTVAPDCSGTTSLTDEHGVQTHYVIVIQQNGLVVGYVGTDANAVTAGYESRRTGSQGDCSASTLNGTYIYANDGFDTGVSTQRSPFAQAGVEVYNGDGTMSGSVTANSNGVVQQVEYDGSYSIDEDCSGQITSAGADQEPLHFAIYVDPTGDEFAFVRVGADVTNAGYDTRR